MERKNTKEIIAESFQEVAEQKNVDKITISDIVANCGMSSATFYRHFRDKYALITWIYVKNCDETYEQYRPDSFAWASRCRAANIREFLYWKVKTDTRHLLGDKLYEKLKLLKNDVPFLL